MNAITQAAGERMHALVRELFPICRSITGEGLRETLRRIGAEIPLTVHEVPTGTPAFDWQVPREWNIRAARIETPDGRVVVDFADNSLHVVGYSQPVDRMVTREELAGHVHTLPDQPSLVPYRTAYYAETWGFCIAHAVWEKMREAHYRVVIDSTLTEGAMSYGEVAIPGLVPDEVLFSVHCCHPGLANDNLSGIALATELARRLARRDNRLSYRFLFIPATIGSLVWLSRNEAHLDSIRHGLVLTCVGDPGPFHYKQSRHGDAVIDRAVAHVLAAGQRPHTILPFVPWGYDERQYCSPGIDLPVGCFMRSPNGTFPQYHTSADNPDFVTAEALEASLGVLLDVVDLLERNLTYERVDGRGEPQLGSRGLYRLIGGGAGQAGREALLWTLNLADGQHSLLDIAERSGLPFAEIAAAAKVAVDAGLLAGPASPGRQA